MRRYFSSSEAQMTNIQKKGPKTLSKSAGLLHSLQHFSVNGAQWRNMAIAKRTKAAFYTNIVFISI